METYKIKVFYVFFPIYNLYFISFVIYPMEIINLILKYFLRIIKCSNHLVQIFNRPKIIINDNINCIRNYTGSQL